MSSELQDTSYNAIYNTLITCIIVYFFEEGGLIWVVKFLTNYLLLSNIVP